MGLYKEKIDASLTLFGVSYDVLEMTLWQEERMTGWRIIHPKET